MTDLTEFLLARIDDDEAAARRMADAVWPQEVAVVPSMDTGEAAPDEPQGCVSVGPQYAPKAYARVWNPTQTDGRPPGADNFDTGWRFHESATVVWGRRLAVRLLADCAAKRRIVEEHAVAAYGDDWQDGAVVCSTCVDPDGWMVTTLPTERHYPCATLRFLAAVYDSHPDYDERWRP